VQGVSLMIKVENVIKIAFNGNLTNLNFRFLIKLFLLSSVQQVHDPAVWWF
jgi:hypothetical protein